MNSITKTYLLSLSVKKRREHFSHLQEFLSYMVAREKEAIEIRNIRNTFMRSDIATLLAWLVA